MPQNTKTMNISSKLKSSALSGLIGLTLIASPGRTATTVTNGDIFAAFRSTGSDTIKSYIVDLGSYTQFTNVSTFGSFSFGSTGTTGADLAYAFGTNWFNRSDIAWSIYGDFTSSPVTVFAGAAESSTNTLTTPYDPLGNALSATKSGVNTVNNGFKNSTPGTTTASTNGINAGFQTGTGAGTYVSALTANLGQAFNSGSTISVGKFEGAVNGTRLQDLYAIDSTNTIYYGTFNLDTNGVISGVSAVPEPASYVLFGLGAFLFSVTYRRRSQQS